MTEVNRTLPDPALDDVDHALGRPRDPLNPPRNHYALDPSSPEAVRMAHSPWWRRGRSIPGGLVYYHVTEAGRSALKEALDGPTGQSHDPGSSASGASP